MGGVARQPEQPPPPTWPARRRSGSRPPGKILAKWQKDGSVTRTPGIAEGGRRAADLWTLTDTATDVDTAPTEHTPAGDTSVDDAVSADTERAAATVPESTDAETADGGPTELTDTAADHVPDAIDAGATDPAKAEPVVAESTMPAAHSAAADGGTATGGKKARLAPGVLRGMVEDHLRDHPDEAFRPTAIATALGGKSSGAVSNALDALVAAGTAVQTQESPKRFALAPAK